MLKTKQIILQQLQTQGVLPLFYTDSAEVSIGIVRSLYKAGVRVLEYTNRGQAALENFRLLTQTFKQEAPDLSFGIGTIKTPVEAESFIEAGADFIVSPIVNPQVAAVANKIDMLWIPGCMTPTEIFIAQQNNAALIKLFPSNILGPEFLISIREIFRGQLFMPTGGVELSRGNLSAWFKAGVCAVGIGGKLISKPILENALYDRLCTDTKAALLLVDAARKQSA